MKYGLRVFLAVAVLLSFMPLWGQAANERRCAIKTIIGTATVRKGNETTWKDAKVRMPLKAGDAVRTFGESELELETSEGSIIKVGENSTVEIPEFSAEGGNVTKTKVKILVGNVLSDVKKLTNTKSNFEFETPTAVASIRGTRVGIDVTGEKTKVSVYEGRVYVVPNGAKNGAEVASNQMTTVTKGQSKVTIERLVEPPAKPPKADSVKVKLDSLKVDSTRMKPDSAMMKKDSIRADSAARVPFKPDTMKPALRDTIPAKTQTASAVDSIRAATTVLKLALMTPVDRAIVKPGEVIPVSGTATPGSKVIVNGIAAPVGSGGAFRVNLTAPVTFPQNEPSYEFEVSVEASYNNQTANLTRTVTVSPTKLTLTVTSPTEGQRLTKPSVPISGTVTPGAEVSVGSLKLNVQPNGAFSTELPIADEETDYTVEIEATLEGKTQTITRNVRYAPELRMTITAPQPQQVFTTTQIQVQGQVTPVAGTKVTVQGFAATIQPTGAFTGLVTIPDEEGEADIEIEAVNGDVNKSETRTIVYKRPADTYAPTIQPMSFPITSKQKVLYFTVFDRTVDDEITFYREIDGARESETGAPNSQFAVMLEEGYHDYKAWAVDKTNNTTPKVSGRVGYITSTTWSIRMRKPMSPSATVYLPPMPRDEMFDPKYTVQFTVVNLPNDDPKMLKEVTITNSTTGEAQADRNLYDLDFEFDMSIKRGVTNMITIRAKDLNDVEKVTTISVLIR